MKAFIITLAPVVLLIWIALSIAKGFIEATVIMAGCCFFTLGGVWWIKYCIDHFFNDDDD